MELPIYQIDAFTSETFKRTTEAGNLYLHGLAPRNDLQPKLKKNHGHATKKACLYRKGNPYV